MATEPGPRIQTQLLDEPFGERDLTALRNTVAAHADRLAIGADIVNDLMLVVAELAANAVRHGGGQGRLRVWVTERSIICRVSDNGPGLSQPLPTSRPPATVAGGRGLWLVQQYADTVEVDNPATGGAIVTATLHRRD